MSQSGIGSQFYFELPLKIVSVEQLQLSNIKQSSYIENKYQSRFFETNDGDLINSIPVVPESLRNLTTKQKLDADLINSEYFKDSNSLSLKISSDN